MGNHASRFPNAPFFLYTDGAIVPQDVTHVCVHPSVAAIPDRAFVGHRQLKEVVLPEGLEEIGRRAFNSCRSLKRINFPSTLTAIGPFAFGHCTSLREVDLSKVTTIGTSAFGGCRALERINIPSTVTTVIGAAAFCWERWNWLGESRTLEWRHSSVALR